MMAAALLPVGIGVGVGVGGGVYLAEVMVYEQNGVTYTLIQVP
jgi:hypothetical protein